MKSNFKQESFKKLKEDISAAINEVFLEVLGETNTMVVWYYLRLRTGLYMGDVIEKPEVFINFLRDTFKDGAKIFEKKIKEKLCHRFKINLENIENIELIDIIKQVMIKY